MTEKVELIGLNKAELDRLMADIGEKPFRAKQLYQWLYVQGAVSFDEMTNLSKDLRAKLADKFTITRPKIVAEQLSRDKTHKWLLEFADGQRLKQFIFPKQTEVRFVFQLRSAVPSAALSVIPGRRKLPAI